MRGKILGEGYIYVEGTWKRSARAPREEKDTKTNDVQVIKRTTTPTSANLK